MIFTQRKDIRLV